MKRIALAASCGFILMAAAALTQVSQQSAIVINRMSGAYRSLQSFYDTATIKRKAGKEESEGTLTLAALRPNKFLLDLTGDRLNTTIVCDGASLTTLRPDRKVYTKLKAPLQMIRADFLGTT